MNLAPIGITVYTRLDHTKKTIEALKKNTLATKSNLYIFSDAAKKGDEEKVRLIRSYLSSIDGFKNITIIERSENSRIQNNRGGQKYLLDKYGKMIWLAEDIVTARGFLSYINKALDMYETRKDILSICSYTPDIDTSIINEDIYLMNRFNTWGFGIWKDRYEKITNISKKDYQDLRNDKNKIEYIKKYCGEDLFEWFKAEFNRSINGLDTKGTFLGVKSLYFSVYPRKSLSFNIGHDGSGLHSGITNKFNVEMWEKTNNFLMPFNVGIDNNLLFKLALFYSSKKNNISQYVIDQILNKINRLKIRSLSIWGTGDLAEKIYYQLKNTDIQINFFLDSWPNDEQTFYSKKVITPGEAILNGEQNIVIASIGNRYKMFEKIRNNNLQVVYYEA